MPVVQLPDIYNPLTYNAAIQEAAIESNAFIAAGVMANDAQLNIEANSPGSIGELPFYLGLGNPQADGTNEPNYSTDDPAVKSVPAKITSGKQVYRKAFLNKSWSTMDLAREIALQDPVAAITGRIGKYWAVNTEQRVIQSAMGVLADNVANDGSDMVFSVANDAVGAPGAAEKINSDAVIAAKATMGDAAGGLTVIAMHSVVKAELERQEVIQYEKAAGTDILIPFYLGYRVVEDDSLPAVAGVNRITYTTILFGAGAVANGTGGPEKPSEVQRIPDAGDGGGQDVIYSRTTEIIHPVGFAFTSAAVAGHSAIFSELAQATNWNRVYEKRKNIPLAFLQTNG